MRNGMRAGLVTIVAFAGIAFAGDGAKSYDIDWHGHWEAKQVVTYTVHDAADMDTTMGGTSMNQDHQSTDAVYVVRCDEVAANGDATKRTVFVKSWTSAKGGKSDDSLTGALISVEGSTWKQVSGKTGGPLATKWLDKTFGKKHTADPLEEVAPKQLTIGQPWKPDPKVVAASFAKSMEDAPFDVTGVTMEIVLESAEGTPPDASGVCNFKVHLPIGNLPNLPPGAALKAGSGAEITGSRKGPLTKSTMLGVLHMDAVLSMDIDMPTPQGATMTVSTKGKMVEEQTCVAGGEIPATPAPTPAKPPEGGK